MINHAPLFTGVNGFGIAANVFGWNQAFHCEIDDFCQRIVKYYWPKSTAYYDITTTDFTIWQGQIDVMSGGFPCQPFSVAGNQRGTSDDRYLWPEYLRAIREVKPTFVVGENVTGILSMAEREMFAYVDSRNIVRYKDFDNYEALYIRQEKMLVNSICEDLEKEGYQVQTFVIPAAGVGAPHKRDRIFFIAYSESMGWRWWRSSKIRREGKDYLRKGFCDIERFIKSESSPNPNSLQRCKRRMYEEGRKETERYIGAFNSRDNGRAWQDFPTQPPVCSGDDGLSTRLDGITFSKLRKESLKAFGNAIVPEAVIPFYEAIDIQIKSPD